MSDVMQTVAPEPVAQTASSALWPSVVFVLLCAAWLLALCLPCLRQDELMYLAEDAVHALMAAVILLAVHTAWCAAEPLNAVLFAVAELLYCGAY